MNYFLYNRMTNKITENKLYLTDIIIIIKLGIKLKLAHFQKTSILGIAEILRKTLES